MTLFIIICAALLTAVAGFSYIRLRLQHRSRSAKPVPFIFLPFLAYLLCVLLFRLNVPWHVLLWGAAAQFVQLFVGYYRNAFERSTRFDRYMHALACFAYGLLIYGTLAAITGEDVSPLYAALMSAAFAETFGVLMEHFEFTADLHGKSPVKHQKSLRDTNFDLLANSFGALCAGIYAYMLM